MVARTRRLARLTVAAIALVLAITACAKTDDSPDPARWVRVTGTDLDTIDRYAYDPDRQEMKRMTPTS